MQQAYSRGLGLSGFNKLDAGVRLQRLAAQRLRPQSEQTNIAAVTSRVQHRVKLQEPCISFNFLQVHLQESSGYDKVLSSFIRVFFILADSELIPFITQPISMRSHWKNKWIVIWQLMSKKHMIFHTHDSLA